MKDIETHTLRQFRGALAELAQQHFDDPVLSITLRRHLQGALKAIDQIISTSCQSDVTKAKGHTPKA